jgi:A/G-specific adenine glycosylase
MALFSTRIIEWQKLHGRHNLPWQGADAYRVWLSEIMLQQTQVVTVIPYYQRFVESFPIIAMLAAATADEVLSHWSGLGYYARGRNLHKSAKIIVDKYRGVFPRQFEQILELPGIGRSTAAAICALAYHERRSILDGNVKRVLTRYLGISGVTSNKTVENRLWQQADALLPHNDVATYIQAQMDIGATICTRSKPKCGACPVQSDCVALRTNSVAELPTPKVRKAVPEKNTTFLLLTHGNDILLEKREAQGIWGGMWCPPQIEDGLGVTDDYVQRNGIVIRERIEMDEFTHTFTHFKLHITPVLLRLIVKPVRVQQSGSEWIDVDAALKSAIPAPVRKLLLLLPPLPKAG